MQTNKKNAVIADAPDCNSREQQVYWQPLGMMPVIGDLIDTSVNHTAEQVETQTEVRAKPHVVYDGMIDSYEQVFCRQLRCIEFYTEQFRRWRIENPTAMQRREIDRLEMQTSRLRQMNAEILRLAAEIRKGGTSWRNATS